MRIFRRFLTLLILLTSQYIYARTISGTITDKENGGAVVGVTILVKGTLQGTISGLDGNFTLFTGTEYPLTLVVSCIGFTTQEILVASDSVGDLRIALEEESVVLGQEVVVSASRVEESILKSPATIQKLDILDIRESPRPIFMTS